MRLLVIGPLCLVGGGIGLHPAGKLWNALVIVRRWYGSFGDVILDVGRRYGSFCCCRVVGGSQRRSTASVGVTPWRLRVTRGRLALHVIHASGNVTSDTGSRL